MFTIAYAALRAAPLADRSPTFDEPLHLAAGYAALVDGDYRVDPTHPPLARMWAALPLLALPARAFDTHAIDAASPEAWPPRGVQAARAFLYSQPNPDRALETARAAIAVLGVVLGWLLFVWVETWLGFVPAVVGLVLYATSPNLAAHATLVTTDFPVTCACVAAVYACSRVSQRATPRAILGLTAAVAAAVLSKFSGLVLLPLTACLLAAAALRGSIGWKPAARAMAVVLVGVTLATWAAYRFRYQPSASAGWVFGTTQSALIADKASRLSTVVRWVDAHRLLPNAFSHGLALSLAASRTQMMYLTGQYSQHGWWYYFPLAILLKTPLALLILALAGFAIFSTGRQGRSVDAAVFVAAPIAVVLAGAVWSGINIGLRHILPIYPFLIVAAAGGAAGLLARRSRAATVVTAALVAVCVLQFARIYPFTLTFFNALAGGPQQGPRYLSDSNIDWGQHLPLLRDWMRTNGVARVNLGYFGTADPRHYGIDAIYLPGTPEFDGVTIARPELPGYVALSVNVLTGQYLRPEWRMYYRGFRDLEPVANLGNTIRVYWVRAWPEASSAPVSPDELQTSRALAVGLASLGSHEHAALHFRQYLSRHPDDVPARNGLVLSLLNRNQVDRALRHAALGVAIRPFDPRSHYLLAVVHTAARRPQEAERELETALQLDPSFAPAGDALTRLRSAR